MSGTTVWTFVCEEDYRLIYVFLYQAYIQPVLSKLSNLHVVTEAHVSRVLLSTPGDGSLPIAEGVEFLQGGDKRTVKASKEVILSAGEYIGMLSCWQVVLERAL